jgi:hypothetical protein
MSQHIGRILQLLESGGLALPEDEPDSAGGGAPKTGGRRESTAAVPRKASRGSMLSDSHISVGSLFGEEAEEEGGELLDDYTVAQLSARRRSNLGRIVEARTAAPVSFTCSSCAISLIFFFSVPNPYPDPTYPHGFGPPGSGSICQMHRSADPDPDPHQNVMDPEHCFLLCCGWAPF